MLVEQSFVKVYPDTIDRLATAGAVVRRADFTPGILHAKYIVVDQRTCYLGSQNFDWRALEHIVELGARFDDAILVRNPREHLHVRLGTRLTIARRNFATTGAVVRRRAFEATDSTSHLAEPGATSLRIARA